jgi:uroporphyrinogen III methyltransferase/synthase
LSKKHITLGARGSQLSVAQARASLHQISSCFEQLELELKTIDTAGDVDLTTSLTSGKASDDFFTNTLDQAVLDGSVDAAIHSAKDLPNYEGSDIDWFYLPWREDPRDTVIWPKDRERKETAPVVGISSPSREAYAKERWPDCIIKPIRGSIENRIEQMDQGDFDVIILAVAGLKRLGIAHRMDEILSLEELPTHEDQGAIAITFKKGHPTMAQLRHLLTPPVTIAGAGTGKDGNYSVATQEALRECDICFHDTLLAPEILKEAKGILKNVGKRFGQGNPGERQRDIIRHLLNYSRKGFKVVRLKGGDPSLFGRLSEEVDALIDHDIPFTVLPGIPWLCSAPIRHGIYLTERQNVRHFQVATGTEIEGKAFDGRDLDPEKGPIYFFMAVSKLPTIVEGLGSRGFAPDTPCAVLREDPGEEHIVRSTLGSIVDVFSKAKFTPPALFIVGQAADPTKGFTPPRGPLHQQRILLPGTERTRRQLSDAILHLGGTPIHLPAFELCPVRSSERDWVHHISEFDWIVLSSGSAVDVLLDILMEENVDLRKLPNIAVSGPSAAKALQHVGIVPDYIPQSYTSRDLGEGMLRQLNIKDQKVLIPRSSASVSPLPTILEDAGAVVSVETLYWNKAIAVEELPEFDAVCFCSPSSLQSLLPYTEQLREKTLCSIGPVTSKAMEKANLPVHVSPNTYDAKHLVWALASFHLWEK